MEGKKMWILLGILGVILLSPVIAFNGASMGCYQGRIDKYPDSPSSKDWQLRLATIYYNSLRADKAGQCYKKFWQRYADDARRPMAIERHAEIYEELGMKREASEVWKILAREYPDDNRGKLALAKLNNDYRMFTYDPDPVLLENLP
ncbi:MAG TPA: tetratricopeptide repeat protein [Planctomycetota bacterium]|nr:tetratricopeptide repeat protein [Planctomycetota bacterium]